MKWQKIQQKMFCGPKKVESLCCMWLYHKCGGWPERKGKERRERKRDLQHTHWQIWSVCSAGLFLAEEMGKSHAGTLQTTEKKWYTLNLPLQCGWLPSKWRWLYLSLLLSLISLSPFCLWCIKRQLRLCYICCASVPGLTLHCICLVEGNIWVWITDAMTSSSCVDCSNMRSPLHKHLMRKWIPEFFLWNWTEPFHCIKIHILA